MAGEWWREAVIYQIYPRSFQDSDDDGVGDVAGVTRRLGYLEWLGVDAIWLSPIYPSPMADYGYDVSDYRDVDPVFGDLNTLEALIAEAHRRRMKIILDFVPNHTSDRHPWFLESRSSRSSRKRAGTSGAIRPPTAARRTIGSPVSAARPGPATARQASTITTPTCPSSRTSTGAIRTSGAR